LAYFNLLQLFISHKPAWLATHPIRVTCDRDIKVIVESSALHLLQADEELRALYGL